MAGAVAALNAPGHLTAVMLSKHPGGGMRGPEVFFKCKPRDGGGTKASVLLVTVRSAEFIIIISPRMFLVRPSVRRRDGV